MKTENGTQRDVYTIVTDRILKQLDKGVIPWHQPWASSGPPRNLITKRMYRGINLWLLLTFNYPKNFFITQKQLKDIGATPKEKETPALVVYWNWKEAKDETSGEVKLIPFLRYYRVFNIDQCEGIPSEIVPEDYTRVNNPIAACEKVVLEMPIKPEIKHKENRAFYNPLEDWVNMPRMKFFENPESYYSVLFHELLHSTGHASRVGRKEILEMQEFGSEAYSIEELTAEMGSCYLQSHCGIVINEFENNASYINGWIGKLKNDKRFIIHASGKAQQAVDFILNLRLPEKEKDAVLDETSTSEVVL
ncbi:MAG TPA: zincin-like metallopeptidase domain-containing protein [Bacteroidia bacterium]|nr:zincin-like metallopeptidase domain-containing protein [Bacteroidia bacterium]